MFSKSRKPNLIKGVVVLICSATLGSQSQFFNTSKNDFVLCSILIFLKSYTPWGNVQIPTVTDFHIYTDSWNSRLMGFFVVSNFLLTMKRASFTFALKSAFKKSFRAEKPFAVTYHIRVAQYFKHEKFIWDLADSYSLRKRNAEKCKNFWNRTTFRYANLRSKFYYITHLYDIGENGKIEMMLWSHFT